MTTLDGPEMNPPDGRRLRIYRYSPELLIFLGRGPAGRLVEIGGAPIPEDARVHGVAFDHDRACFVLRVESEAFDEVPDGMPIPTADEPWFKVREVDPELLKPAGERKPLF